MFITEIQFPGQGLSAQRTVNGLTETSNHFSNNQFLCWALFTQNVKSISTLNTSLVVLKINPFFQYVGLFMLGFHSGLFLGLIGLCAADLSGEEFLRPASPWAAVGVLILAGLVMALLNLGFQVRKASFHSLFKLISVNRFCP